jgi:hypothetical protein
MLALKYTLIYGIQTLNEHYPLQQLSITKLEELLRTNNSFQTIVANIPIIQDRLRLIKQSIDEFDQNLQSPK